MARRDQPKTPQATPSPVSAPAAPPHRPGSARRARSSTDMQLNLTSMIDVIFLLLVYFVITASFSVGEGVITARLPQGISQPPPTPARPPDQPLVILISSAGAAGYRVGIEGMPAADDFLSLQEQLRQLLHDPEAGLHGMFRADNPVVIRPDGRVRWQHVVNAFNAAVAASYTNVRFASTN